MTPPHTPESLLALTKSPEGLEQLWVAAAIFDKWTKLEFLSYHKKRILVGSHPDSLDSDKNFPNSSRMDEEWLAPVPPFPTSLDAIFAAEERLGLHDNKNEDLRSEWRFFMRKMFADLHRCNLSTEIALLPPPIRLIPFILTAQWKEQNP